MKTLEQRFPKTDFYFRDGDYKEILSTDEEIAEFHSKGWGGENIMFTKIELEELLSGKAIGWSDGEYTHVIALE
ncbi:MULTISPECIES: hypothetical protein [Streptococcus]|uniref:hypothetical protein n=1 Tax=Streptococcus TaxID=1301 RepID=UPI000414C9BF|nr:MULTISPECIES: hypothetical protein [Streptococcus]MCK3889258.1 hypothetical protein [Streptococcus suis]NQM06046.1 hypothetical protein [Streptococcus suis]NQM28063.1 hypothetical protein [Streptococcus suis]HEM2769942.1 hypothetical protein [Streptococcus suis]HEM3661156.1 hypothetical protein [Streptococcus suis]